MANIIGYDSIPKKVTVSAMGQSKTENISIPSDTTITYQGNLKGDGDWFEFGFGEFKLVSSAGSVLAQKKVSGIKGWFKGKPVSSNVSGSVNVKPGTYVAQVVGGGHRTKIATSGGTINLSWTEKQPRYGTTEPNKDIKTADLQIAGKKIPTAYLIGGGAVAVLLLIVLLK